MYALTTRYTLVYETHATLEAVRAAAAEILHIPVDQMVEVVTVGGVTICYRSRSEADLEFLFAPMYFEHCLAPEMYE